MPRIKLRHIPPNLVTASSLVLALASVMVSRAGNFHLAAWMILWCVVLDKLDGTVARLLKAGSSFGVEFDSVADFCAFGIAPGFLFYEMLLQHPVLGPLYAQPTNTWLLGAAVCLYVLAVGARLARFNVDTPVMGDKFFIGIPTTATGALLAAIYLTVIKYDLSVEILRYYPIYLVITGLLMVSPIRLPKLTRRKSHLMNFFQVANFAAVVVCGILMEMPEYLLTIGVIYLVVGVIWARFGSPRRAARPI